MTKSARPLKSNSAPQSELEELCAELPEAEAIAAAALTTLTANKSAPDCLSKFLYAQSKLRAIEHRINELKKAASNNVLGS